MQLGISIHTRCYKFCKIILSGYKRRINFEQNKSFVLLSNFVFRGHEKTNGKKFKFAYTSRTNAAIFIKNIHCILGYKKKINFGHN
jgi:hypothetical protein